MIFICILLIMFITSSLSDSLMALAVFIGLLVLLINQLQRYIKKNRAATCIYRNNIWYSNLEQDIQPEQQV